MKFTNSYLKVLDRSLCLGPPKFVNSLELFGIGYSWGGFESLAILQELRSSQKDEYLQGRKYFRFNKDEHIVRLHIGLEDPKDLINDLKRSLRYIE